MAVPIIPILKKIGTAVLSNKKGRKTVLYIILTVTIIVMLPAIAVMGIFSNDVRIDTSEIEGIMQEREKIEAERHAEIARIMTDAGYNSLYPHIGDVRSSDVYMQAYLLNNPFISLKANGSGALPAEFSLISTDKQNVIVDTIKKAEDSEDVIVRLFECSNKTTNVTVKLSIPVKKVVVCDLMEKESDFVLQSNQTFKLTVKPFEIITLKLCI